MATTDSVGSLAAVTLEHHGRHLHQRNVSVSLVFNRYARPSPARF